MFGFVKQIFISAMLLFGSNVPSVNLLKCISINNQECKARSQMVSFNSEEPVFFMSRNNKTRHTKWHETCKCKCRLNASVCNNKQRWNDDKCRCECKELIDKDMCDKGFIWNPSNCECEIDKSCDTGEGLGYENCKCRKKLVDNLVEECTDNVQEVKIAKITLAAHENKHKCSSCTLYIVLFSIVFTINVGIGTYFVYHKYMNRDKKTGTKESFNYQTALDYQAYKIAANTKSTDIKNITYYFFDDMINIENFDSSLLRIDKKSHKDTDIYYIGYITIKKFNDCENFHSVNPLYLIINSAIGH